MIVSIILLVAGTILQVVGTLLGLVSYVLPTEIHNAILWLFQKAMLLQGIFPMDTLFTALFTVMVIVGLNWTFKLIIFVLNFIPGVKARLFTNKK